MQLTCPKCQGPMRSYERNGVHIEQCSDCRGIFLDRGELDRLIDAEDERHGERSRQPTQPRSAPGPGPYGGYTQGYGYPRRKKSLLSELFD